MDQDRINKKMTAMYSEVQEFDRAILTPDNLMHHVWVAQIINIPFLCAKTTEFICPRYEHIDEVVLGIQKWVETGCRPDSAHFDPKDVVIQNIHRSPWGGVKSWALIRHGLYTSRRIDYSKFEGLERLVSDICYALLAFQVRLFGYNRAATLTFESLLESSIISNIMVDLPDLTRLFQQPMVGDVSSILRTVRSIDVAEELSGTIDWRDPKTMAALLHHIGKSSKRRVTSMHPSNTTLLACIGIYLQRLTAATIPALRTFHGCGNHGITCDNYIRMFDAMRDAGLVTDLHGVDISTTAMSIIRQLETDLTFYRDKHTIIVYSDGKERVHLTKWIEIMRFACTTSCMLGDSLQVLLKKSIRLSIFPLVEASPNKFMNLLEEVGKPQPFTEILNTVEEKLDRGHGLTRFESHSIYFALEHTFYCR